MQIPIELRSDASRSLQAQLFDELVGRIEDGRLAPGVRMPPTRELAADLGVSRNTVALTYERLVAEGFVEARPPLGTFVARHGTKAVPPQPAPGSETGVPHVGVERAPPRFRGCMHALHPPHAQAAGGAAAVQCDFWVGRPDPRLFPAPQWRKLVELALAEATQHGDGSYGEPAGLARLRTALAAHAGAARSIVCSRDDIVVTNGIQEGINVVARLLLAPGVAVGMENPGYAGAAHVFASYGARVLPVEVDDEGAVPGTLPPECRLMYLTPAHQYPSGVALSPARRRAWLQWAERSGGWLIEDDYDSDFFYDTVPLPALKAADAAGCVIHLGTFSKSLAADLRLGYMIVPPLLRDAAVTVKGLLTNGSPWLVQSAMAGFIEGGEFVHHLRRLRKHYVARRDALLAALARLDAAGAAVIGGQAGMHVVWHAARDQPDATQIERRCRALGVGVYGLASGNAWLADDATARRWARALLLGYAALGEDEIARGIECLGRALRPQPGRADGTTA
ncbi:MAG: PLP-dependent aminotransferase family protein [Proteobacteria bacterium]|nr:PLP-dependent aminotransferase family protein [Pseudomonadota bacterium]